MVSSVARQLLSEILDLRIPVADEWRERRASKQRRRPVLRNTKVAR